MEKLWPVRVKVISGRLSRLSHSTVYWPLYDFLAPISLFLCTVSGCRTIVECGYLQELGDGGGESDEGGTSVEDDTGVVEVSGVLTKGDRIEVDLPVSLAAEGKLDHLASVVALVYATESSDRLLLLVGVAKVEREDGFIKQVLSEHVVKRGDHLVDTDGVVAKTEDTVEPAEGESKTRLVGRLGEVLVLDGEITDLDGVLRDETAQATRAVADLELRAVLLVR